MQFNTIATSEQIRPEINLSNIAALQNLTNSTTVIFRLYAWGASSNTGTFGFGADNTANSLAFGGNITTAAATTINDGNWHESNTWLHGHIPNSNENANILHQVTTQNITRNLGTETHIYQTGNLILANDFNNHGKILVEGTLQINPNGQLNNNAPIYKLGASLIYNTQSTYNKSTEWTNNSIAEFGIDEGFPHHVTIQSGTTLLCGINGSNSESLKLNGNLSIQPNASCNLNGAFPMQNPLTINGNLETSGTLELSSNTNGYVRIYRNLIATNNYNFITHNNGLHFANNTLHTINATIANPICAIFMENSSSETTVKLISDVAIVANNLQPAIGFNNTNNVIDLNGFHLKIGIPEILNTINGEGSFKGGLYNTTSQLSLSGNGYMGILNFHDNFKYLQSLSLNFVANQIGVSLGNQLTVTYLNLTNGILNTDTNNLIISETGNITGASQNNFIIAQTEIGGTLRKNFPDGTNSNRTFTFPIGSNAQQFTPATLTLNNSKFDNAYLTMSVNNEKHPNNDAPDNFINRYWQVFAKGITLVDNYSFTGNYLSTDVSGDESQIKAGRFYTLNNTWSEGNLANIPTNSLSISGGNFTISATNGNHNIFTGGSPFSIMNIEVRGNGIAIENNSQTTTSTNYTEWVTTKINENSTRTFEIANTGVGNLTIQSIEIEGQNSDEFLITTYPNAIVSGPNGISNFTVQFNPISTGNKTAYLKITNNDPDPSDRIFRYKISAQAIDYILCGFENFSSIINAQNFENTTSSTQWHFTSNTPITITNGTGFATAGDNGSTPKYIGTNSWQINNQTNVLQLHPINTLELNNIELHLDVASFSTINNDGADTSDFVIISVSTNNGITWSDELKITGFQQAKWPFNPNATRLEILFDGNQNIESFKQFKPEEGNYVNNPNFGRITLKNIPQTENLVIKITASNNTNQEIWAIDNISLKAQKKATKYWSGSQWVNSLGNPTSSPTESDKVEIQSDYNTASTNQSIHACECLIQTGKTVELTEDFYLKIQNNLVNNGIINLKNAANLVQLNDDAINFGSINMERTTTPIFRFDYVYWSSPLKLESDFKLIQVSPLTLATKFHSYNVENNTWFNHNPLTHTMIPGHGYIIRGPSLNNNLTPSSATPFTANFTGIPNNGMVNVPIIHTMDGWNLIGNPYPSAIDATAFLTANQAVIDGAIYFWTHNTSLAPNQNQMLNTYASSDYATFNLLGSVSTSSNPNNPSNLPNGYIASGQSFFVKSNANGNAIFNNKMRVVNNNRQFFRQAIAANSNSDTNIEKNRIWINLTKGSNDFSQMLLGYCSQATNNEDWGYDAESFSNNSVTLYSILNQKNLSIQGRSLPFNNQEVVAIGFNTNLSGDHKIAIDSKDEFWSDKQIYLEDLFLNTINDITNNPYTFHSEAGRFNDRFLLKFANHSNLDLTNVEKTANKIQLIKQEAGIHIKSSDLNLHQITVYNLLGQTMNQFLNIEKNDFDFEVSNHKNQIILIEIILENGSKQLIKTIN